MKFLAVMFVLALSMIGCSTTNHEETLNYKGIERPPGKYTTVLDRWTTGEKSYASMSAAYQVTATLQAMEVVEHQVFQDAQQYQWSAEQLREARQKALYEAQNETTVFVSLYTDKDDTNVLDKKDSVWNIFLDVSGQRVMPKSIKRVYENKVALAAKYPYHNIWSKPYIIKFPIGTVAATSGAVGLTLAGPLGGSFLKFSK
ncbi:MAG: hypothetical protein SGI74_10840 [Oligoflexia bacterium]|nr:hypothetical protein [Oligoflexia bacterium]